MRTPEEIVRELVSLDSENEVVEFKEANNTYDSNKLGKYFSALSNEARLRDVDYAWLVFGVRDADHAFINSRYRLQNTSLQNLKAEIAQHTSSGITFTNIFAFDIEPGQRVVLFQIPACPVGIPTDYKGFFYARNHSDLSPLSIDKIERLRITSPAEDWSKSTIQDASMSDLDSEAITKARLQFKKKHPHLETNVDRWSNKTFLNKAKITINGRITNTAILLLGKEESVHFISPAVSKISWILKSKDGSEVDYEHFTSPLLLNIDKVYRKIRILKYRYMKEGSLFPEEVNTYDPEVIREALNNCIAHQDYPLGGKVNIIENEEESLVFTNSGSFLPLRVENVINSDAPAEFYRNRFLADAMVNLGMIDTIGSGIRKMFNSQRKKFFPLPDYHLTTNRVTLTITGKVLDLKYAHKLAQIPELSLGTIMLLDKVQKKKSLTADEAQRLREQNLIEGKRPNLHISSGVAKSTDQKTAYMHLRGIEDSYAKKMILDLLTELGAATRREIEDVLISKLPSGLSLIQKKAKVRNLLQSLKRQDKIRLCNDRTWEIV